MSVWKRRLAVLVCGLTLVATWTTAAGTRDEVLKKRKALMKELEKTIRKNMNVPPSDGAFLKLLVESAKTKRALEIGSSNGYSAIWIGSGLEQTGGHLWTIEIDPGRAAECRENLKKAGLDKVVTSIEADAFKAIPKIEGEFDFVFIDAWKPDYIKFFKMVFPRLKEGGIIAAHNAIRQASQMQYYLDAVTNNPEIDSVFIITAANPRNPMRDGFCVSYKKRKEKE